MRRMPATSGIVSRSKTRMGVMRCASAPSGRKHAGGQVAVAAVAHDEDDGGVAYRGDIAERDCAGAATQNPHKKNNNTHKTTQQNHNNNKRHVFELVDSRGIVDLG